MPSLLQAKAFRERLLALAAYALIAVWLTGFNPWADRYLVPTDLLYLVPSIRDEVPPAKRLIPVSGARSDVIDNTLPALIAWKAELESRGHFSKWNPYVAGGEPAYANMTMGIWSIRNLPLLFLDVPTGFSVGVILLFIVAGFGTYLFLRRRTRGLPAFLGGAIFMFAGFNVSWAQWPHFEVSALIPWMFLGGALIYDRRYAFGFALTVLATWQLLVGGFPAVAAFTFYGLFIASVCVYGASLRDPQRRDARETALVWIGALWVGILCAAHQLVPFAEYLRLFDLSYRTASGIGIRAADWLIHPFHNPRGLFPEDTSYVGKATLVLIALAPALIARRRKSWTFAAFDFYRLELWLALSAFFWVAVFAYPAPLFRGIIAHLPVFATNPCGRALSVLGFAMAVTAALVADEITLAWAGNPSRRHFATALLLFLTGYHLKDVQSVVQDALRTNPKFSVFPETPAIQYMKQHLLPGQWVVATQGTVLISGTLTAHQLGEPFAHSFFRTPDKALYGQLVKDPWVTTSASRFDYAAIHMDSPWMKVLSVRYVFALRGEFTPLRSALPPQWRVAFEGPATVVLENTAVTGAAYVTEQNLAQAFDADHAEAGAQKVQATSFSNDERSFKVTTAHPSFLVAPIRIWPGWIARVNGQPTPLIGLRGSILAVPVPAGDSQVELSYEPGSTVLGAGLSLIGGVLALAIVGWLWRRDCTSSRLRVEAVL